jgi:hypothetical protein
MKRLLTFLLVAFTLSACHQADKSFLSAYLRTGNLSEQSFTINPDVDTTLVSSGGVRIYISKGTFPAGKAVTIEWKEALDFQSILKAGLTTQSGKEILRSGGMFYFNTKEQLDIQKPMGIDVPTQTIVSGMQLYKGDSSSGKLDWKDPKPIENVKIDNTNWTGNNLFLNNCAQCHKTWEDLTGPALAGVLERGPWRNKQKLYAWIHNPTGFMAHDSYTQCLKCKYGVVMQGFPGLSSADIDSIIDYVGDEAERLGLAGKIQNSGCDSCVAYRQAYDSLMALRDSFDKINNNSIDVDYDYAPGLVHYIEDYYPKSERSKVKLIAQLDNKSDYYHIQIDVPGWYNIDGLLEEWSGSIKSRLVIKMKGTMADKQEVYLVIPSHKVFVQGGYLDNRTDIGFLETNGTIKLPQQTQAFVFAVGEQKGKFIFSHQDFVTTTNQTIILTTQLLSREQFDLKMLEMGKSGFKVSTDTTIHFSSLKILDTQLMQIQATIPKNCGCWEVRDSSSNK